MTDDSFFGKLAQRGRQSESLLCVGLDPHPEFLDRDDASVALAWCRRMIAATAEWACAFKANSAFFEAYGAAGWEALRQLVAELPEGIPFILDAKRGDIASTAEAYARAAFETLGAGAVTVSPFLGWDAVAPFLAWKDRGVFLLCKTSNPGSEDFQTQPLGNGEPLYLEVARQAAGRGDRNLGLVVGATDPEALAAVRRAAPEAWIIAPGVGAQGGDLEAAVAAGVRADGLGLLVVAARSLANANDPGEEARGLARRIRAANSQRLGTRVAPSPLPPGLWSLAEGLFASGCVRLGEFRLKSGETSPIYFDLRLLASHPHLLASAASAYRPLLERLGWDLLAAVPYAGLPIGTALALQTGSPLIYPRREVKPHGTQVEVEGAFRAGARAVLIDDVITSGDSKLEAAARLRSAGLVVEDVVVLVDRRSNLGVDLASSGLRLHAVFRLADLLAHWRLRGLVDDRMIARLIEPG
jgi:uridine monophosphate synthetase